MAVLGIIHGSAALASSSSFISVDRNSGGICSAPSFATSTRSPTKRSLKQNRSYLETGSLCYDDAVVAYMHRLEEHRKRCEADGRYAEAQAATVRLADLRTTQVERLRLDLVANQGKEVETVQQARASLLMSCQCWDHVTDLSTASLQTSSNHIT
jgi:hypothetical protein